MKEIKKISDCIIYLPYIFLLFSISCMKDHGSAVQKSVFDKEIRDADGNIYKTVKIGSQLWMAENLRTSKFNDNLNIRWLNPPDKPSPANDTLPLPGYCIQTISDSLNKLLGPLYNWYTVNTGKLCPVGWHVPSKDEWLKLAIYLGGLDTAAYKLKDTEKGWICPPYSGTDWTNGPKWQQKNSANNESHFSALASGMYDPLIGMAHGLGYMSDFWSASESGSVYAWNFGMSCEAKVVYGDNFTKNYGFSVRCVKDSI